jgi:hypothetical protein
VSFFNQEDGEKARLKLDRFGLLNSIISVEWSKPRD